MSVFFNPNGLNNSGGGNGGGGTPSDVPNGTTTQKGLVQLSNAIDSDSQAFAATSKAVKDAIGESNTYTDTLVSEVNFVHKGNNPPANTDLIWKKI